jgi:hypothetical protein
MKKKIKFLFLLFSFIAISVIIYFFAKWSKVNHDNNISNSIGIKNLDKKIFDQTYLILDSTRVKTDFEIFKKANDTVSFNFNANKNSEHPNLLTLHLNSGDGFAGVNVEVYKYKNFFYTSVESYTDNRKTFDFLEPDSYVVKKQKLTLNKSDYKKGDSIFGKIELEIKFTPNDSIYNSTGYFKNIVE